MLLVSREWSDKPPPEMLASKYPPYGLVLFADLSRISNETRGERARLPTLVLHRCVVNVKKSAHKKPDVMGSGSSCRSRRLHAFPFPPDLPQRAPTSQRPLTGLSYFCLDQGSIFSITNALEPPRS